jgi:hypothetical protein
LNAAQNGVLNFERYARLMGSVLYWDEEGTGQWEEAHEHESLSGHAIEAFREDFDRIDADGNGELSVQEILQSLQAQAEGADAHTTTADSATTLQAQLLFVAAGSPCSGGCGRLFSGKLSGSFRGGLYSCFAIGAELPELCQCCALAAQQHAQQQQQQQLAGGDPQAAEA